MIGQAFHDLCQFETRHVNARNLYAVLISDYSSVSKCNAVLGQYHIYMFYYQLKIFFDTFSNYTLLVCRTVSMVSNIFFNHQKNDYMHM